MNAQIKTDFEKWLITQMTKEGVRYYVTIPTSVKAYVNFEGQSMGSADNEVAMTIIPINTDRIASGTKMSEGLFRFYCYSKTQLGADKISDKLASIMDEQTINVTGSFRIELGVTSVTQRNKFADSLYFESVCQVRFWHWSAI